jgi:pilus assembly protein CpaE
MLDLKPRYNIGHLAMDEPSAIEQQVVEDFMLEHRTGVRLLGGFVTPHEVELLTEGHVQRLLDFLRRSYSYVVIDCSHDFHIPTVKALDYASTILMPITPDIASVRVAASALRTFRELDYNSEKIEVIVNWVFPQGGLSTKQIERALDHPVTRTIQYQGASWVEAINLGEPIIETQRRSTTALMLEDLAWDMSRKAELDEVPANPSESYLRVSRRKEK